MKTELNTDGDVSYPKSNDIARVCDENERILRVRGIRNGTSLQPDMRIVKNRKNEDTFEQSIRWSHLDGTHEFVTVSNCSTARQSRKEACAFARTLGWAPPRWWQWWRRHDTRIEEPGIEYVRPDIEIVQEFEVEPYQASADSSQPERDPVDTAEDVAPVKSTSGDGQDKLTKGN